MSSTDDYDQIARHFFNQFLELKLALDKGLLQKPKNYDKDLAAYQLANEKLRGAAADMADQNKKLEEQLALAEEALAKERGEKNALIIQNGLLMEKLKGLGVIKQEAEREGYKFREHMSEESRKLFDQLMRDIPRPGHG